MSLKILKYKKTAVFQKVSANCEFVQTSCTKKIIKKKSIEMSHLINFCINLKFVQKTWIQSCLYYCVNTFDAGENFKLRMILYKNNRTAV